MVIELQYIDPNLNLYLLKQNKYEYGNTYTHSKSSLMQPYSYHEWSWLWRKGQEKSRKELTKLFQAAGQPDIKLTWSPFSS